ncbi:MAG: DNA gyrase C-terminal beta-propeller domain-containing protein, partial [Alphaproteobacteria bacterium]
IADLVRDKKVEGITDLRDESDRHGIRIVIELRRDAEAEVVLNQLYRFTPLQTNFSYNMLALDYGRPRSMGLRDVLEAFLKFREEVVVKRSKFQLKKARDRAHILVGLVIAVKFVDEVVAIIRAAPDPATARERLCARSWPTGDIISYLALIDGTTKEFSSTIQLTETQARAILDLRLQRLTAMGVDEISQELRDIAEDIRGLLSILTVRSELLSVIRQEFIDVKDAFATPRKTRILQTSDMLDDEDLIQREDMIVTITHGGYIKRVKADTYRAQKRGGKGLSGLSMHDDDFVTKLISADTHTPLIFFTTDGMAYAQKVWRLPPASRTARGKAMVNLLPIGLDVRIAAVLPLNIPEEDREHYSIVFVTAKGGIRRNKLTDFAQLRANGKIAMRLGDDDRLVSVRICADHEHLMISTKRGQAIRFQAAAVRIFSGTSSSGVRGIALADGDEVVSCSILNGLKVETDEAQAYLRLANTMRRSDDEQALFDEDRQGSEIVVDEARYAELGAHEQMILAVTTDGYGKRTSSYAYRTTNRGGKGIRAMELASRGDLVAVFTVTESDQLMMVTNMGQMIRVMASDISIQGRSASGVRIFDVGHDEYVVSVTKMVEQTDLDE